MTTRQAAPGAATGPARYSWGAEDDTGYDDYRWDRWYGGPGSDEITGGPVATTSTAALETTTCTPATDASTLRSSSYSRDTCRSMPPPTRCSAAAETTSWPLTGQRPAERRSRLRQRHRRDQRRTHRLEHFGR